MSLESGKISMAGKNNQKFKGLGQKTGRDKNRFTLFSKLLATNEKFPTKHIYGEMKIRELKRNLEFTIGIPQNLQRISYLDEGDLLDHTDIKSNDIVPGGTLQIRVWPMWIDLIEAVASNDIDKVFKLGVTQDTDYKTPNSEYMPKRAKAGWLAERAFVALCVAAHRGHSELVNRLIRSGANLNSSTPNGRTPLHLAASQGHGQIIDSLLQNGADIDAVDDSGMTALMVAEQFKHKACGRHLFLFRWQQRAKKMQPSMEIPLMAHQMCDSAYPVWRSGKRCQLYMTKLPPPGEFEGTRIDSRPYQPFSEKSFRKRFGSPPNLQMIQTTHHGSRLGSQPLPDIGEGLGDFGITTLGPLPPSYDEWINKLHEKERKIFLQKKREEERLRQEEEDRQLDTGRKRAESEKNQSYESWLLQQEMDKNQENRPTEIDPAARVLASRTGYTREASQKKGALREYLESLADRRGATTYSDWLIKKEIEMLDSVKVRPVLKTNNLHFSWV
ncbi:uncharacterized protein LOC135474946 isoform X2 [Liolophura sinensis]|uniref:uncharacterized protein LOC135474946 isoform X2 n=1 Tax=Liolophura sinensis TaxID=3198878 RepID=UPI003158735A